MTVLVGDCREQLAALPAGSVQCCVTSPPYFGLRDYGTGVWEGGDPGCEHKGRPSSLSRPVEQECVCGARRVDRQIGLEGTPDEYVAELVAVFREVRRVLRDDGTVWLNLGDSYNNRTVRRPSSHQGGLGFTSESIERSWAEQAKLGLSRRSLSQDGLKEKDLIGIPWMVAFALRADGWFLRSDVIWAKPNPLPESVRDRPTQAHEHVFLLSKRSSYFYDQDAIREPYAEGSLERIQQGFKDRYAEVAAGGYRGAYGGPDGVRVNPEGRNRRDVWEVATQPFPEAHFATFPPELVQPCVLAGSRPGDVVLDPFAGSGTVGVVCGWYGREFVGVELSPEFAVMAEARIAAEGRLGRRAYRPEPRQAEVLF